MIHHCSSRVRRATLSDSEFWQDVAEQLLGAQHGPVDGEPDLDDELPEVPGYLEPCPECGEYGACMTDAEGRRLIHVVTDPDDQRTTEA
jgi:hypothetical protein